MDPIDTYLGRVLKRWTVQKSPPTDARLRLLQAAASSARRPAQPAIFQKKYLKNIQHMPHEYLQGWANGLFDPPLMNTFELCLINPRSIV